MGKFRLFFKDEYFTSKINVWLIILSLLANLANWIVLLIFLHPATPLIILHYNVYFGVDVTGSRREAFILPGVGLAILIINFILSFYFYRSKERIAGYLLLMVALMAQFSLLVATSCVILINY